MPSLLEKAREIQQRVATRSLLAQSSFPSYAEEIISLLPGDYALLRGLTIGVAVISPEAAMLIREFYANKSNRNFVKANLTRLTEAMRADAFRLNGESLIFSQSGNDGERPLMLDGHHRIESCIEANKCFLSVVVIGVETENVNTLDAGTARTDAHRLTMDGHINASCLNGAIHILANWCKSQIFGRTAPLPYHNKINYWLAKNPKLIESVEFARSHQGPLGFYRSPSAVAFLHYVTTAAHPENAAVFWNSIISKQNPALPGGVVVGLLIDRLVNERGNRAVGIGRQTLDLEKRCQYTFMAWNAFMRGEDITKLQFPQGGKMPRLLGLPYVGNVPVLHGFSYNPSNDS